MLHLTSQVEFKKEVLDEKTRPVLVDFHAEWCPPCKILGPIVDQVDTKENKNIKVIKVDVDKAPELAQEYGIMSIPTTYIFWKGKAAHQFVGVQSYEVLVNESKAAAAGQK
ncbi:MAG: thioredoxin [Candidatus Roizmanbacteria bacterium]|nr:thioredoxin [Candidatus Roizmanbacteria bacterium]